MGNIFSRALDGLQGALKTRDPYVNDPPVTPDIYADAVLDAAQSWVGAIETSRNRGPVVDEIIRLGGGRPNKRHPWCARFVRAVHVRAAQSLSVETTCPNTGGAAKMWIAAGKTGLLRVTPRLVTSGEVELLPGDVMVMARPSKGASHARIIRSGRRVQGHVGIVESVDEDLRYVYTIDGNTDDDGNTEGRRREGAFRQRRPIDAPYMVGFFRVTAVRLAAHR